MSRILQTLFVLSVGCLSLGAEEPGNALAIMNKVAANTTGATDARRQYVYHQKVLGRLLHSDGQTAAKETREYTVIPHEKTTDKTLVSFSGEYREGKRMVPYSQPLAEDKKDDSGDRGMIQSLVDELIDEKNTRDGIPRELFPLRAEDLPYYRFSLKGAAEVRGRRAWDIVFEPADLKNLCIHVGADKEDSCHQWKGEVWIDAEDYQPVRIETQMARGVPWGVRVFMGTNVRQLGFSINYQRIAPNVWFPSTYGTEFRFAVLWGYKRTITLSMESNEFRKTDANSTISFDSPQ